MTTYLMAAALLLTTASAFAYTECSDATGSNRYQDNNYRGGAAPQPKTVYDDVKIYLNGSLASETVHLYDGTVTPGPFVARFDESSMTAINTVHGEFMKDYAIEVSFASTNPSPFPGGGPPPPKFLMLCHEDNTPLP